MSSKASILACFASMLLFVTSPVHALSVGQTDDFEGGTTAGWDIGAAATAPLRPRNVPGGGPAGVNDSYLELNSTGALGPGSVLTAFNLAQWTGDYLAAGITGIEMHARNLGANDLNLFLSLVDFSGSGLLDHVVVSGGVPLAANGDWQKIFFSLDPADLFVAIGTAAGALSSVEAIRIYHSPNGLFQPGANQALAIEATLGLDNISAVPLPGAAWMLISGIIALMGLRRRIA